MFKRRVLSMLAVAAATSLARADKPPGLIAYWDFEEGGGATVLDHSGNGHNGTPQGGYAWDSNASPFPGSNWAGYFGGIGGGNGYVLVPDATDLDPTEDFTFSAWVKANYVEGYKIILGKAGGNQDGSWGWGVGRTGGHLVQYFMATPWSYELYGQDVVTTAQWRHLTMTYDDSDNKYEYWIHGFDGETVSLLGYESSLYDANIMNNAHPLNIGGWGQGGEYSGLLDEVCMFNRVLSEGEIRTLVPEPAALSLTALGTSLIIRRRR